MEKIFENLNFKLFNYFIFIIVFFFSNKDYFTNENFLLLLFLYSKDIIYTNPYLNNLFLENYKFLKSKKNFFKLVCEVSYSILFLYLISILIIYFFLGNNLNWLILIIPFSIINSIIFLLTRKNLQKLNLLTSCIVLFLYILLFQDYKIEIFFIIICILELIFITFFSDYKFRKINYFIIANDIRIIIFFKKLIVNLAYSQLLKIIFILVAINFYFFFNNKNFQFIFYLILLIEIGDLYGNFIRKKFWKNLSSNYQIQKDNHKYYNEIFRLTGAYFLIGAFTIFLSTKYISNNDLYILFFYIIIFFSYNLERVKDLILLTMERSLIYKKHFFYNIISIVLVSLVIVFLYSYEQIILIYKFIIFYFIIYSSINIAIIKKYISSLKI